MGCRPARSAALAAALLTIKQILLAEVIRERAPLQRILSVPRGGTGIGSEGVGPPTPKAKAGEGTGSTGSSSSVSGGVTGDSFGATAGFRRLMTN